MKSMMIIICITLSAHAIEYNFVDSLSPIQKSRLDSVARIFSPNGGCKGTLAQNRKSFICPESGAFYNFGAWFAKEDKPTDYILDKLRQHNQTYYTPKKYILAQSTIPVAGNPKSPISIIAYITADCPHCKQVGIPLHDLVTGAYKGKASFQIKPIHHIIGDYALLAAVEQGKAWELFEAFGDIQGRLDEDAVLKAAGAAKLDVKQLKKAVNTKSEIYKKIIDTNYREAKRNNMNFTPTLYFNGFMYQTNKHPIWIMEYIDYLLRNPQK